MVTKRLVLKAKFGQAIQIGDQTLRIKHRQEDGRFAVEVVFPEGEAISIERRGTMVQMAEKKLDKDLVRA
jgi:hypothetical protein